MQFSYFQIAEVLGRVYAAISRRHGRILAEDYNEETGFFTVRSHLPVIESFGLAEELRGRTSGVAIPQLVFAGFHLLADEDPTDDSGSRAYRYVMGIRERKGWYVERKLVQFAEKQRTLRR